MTKVIYYKLFCQYLKLSAWLTLQWMGVLRRHTEGTRTPIDGLILRIAVAWMNLKTLQHGVTLWLIEACIGFIVALRG